MLGCACGQGVIDWERIVTTVSKADHDVVLSVECGSLEAAQKSYIYLRSLIDRSRANCFPENKQRFDSGGTAG